MKILLVYPEMPDTFYLFKHLTRVVDRKASFPEVIHGLRAVYSLGIKDSNRRYFWGLLYWLFENKKLRYFDLAIFFIAIMYQYKMMWEKFIKNHPSAEQINSKINV
jgi:hypothetical protein